MEKGQKLVQPGTKPGVGLMQNQWDSAGLSSLLPDLFLHAAFCLSGFKLQELHSVMLLYPGAAAL